MGPILEFRHPEYAQPTPDQEAIDCADLLIHYLEKEGVEYVFGIPGGALEPVFNALSRAHEQGTLTPILTKHEQGAAFMADGYARVSGRLGVCCATTGPGATNLTTGIASAYADSIPVLGLTAQIPVGNFGKGAVQDSTYEGVDTVEIFKKFTRYSAMVVSPSLANDMYRRAIRTALSGPRGPVHLSLPSDVMAQPVDQRHLSGGLSNCYVRARHWDREAVKEAAKSLARAERPAMLVGSGALWSGAADEVRELAEFLAVPTATTPKAKGVLSELHELSLGVFGFAGSRRAEEYLLKGEVDVLVTVGTSLNEMATQAWNRKLGNARLIIQIDIDPHQFGKNYPSVLPLDGDAKIVLRELLYEIRRTSRITSIERKIRRTRFADFKREFPRFLAEDARHSTSFPLKPQRLMTDIRNAFSDDTIFFVDNGNNLAWSLHYLTITRPGTFFAGMGFLSMGFAVAAAVGGKAAAPDRPVVAICGDGSFQMNGMEVATAVNHDIPVVWIVFNDSGLGMVRHGQRMSPRAREVCNSFKTVDFVKIAEGLGARGITIEHPGQLDRALVQEVLVAGRPTVIDVRIDPEEPPPIGSRVKALGDVWHKN